MGELQPGKPNTSVLGKDIHTGELVTIDQEQRVKGLYIIGKTGSGKTTLKVNLILQDIEQGMGVCFITPHGDAIADILKRLPCREEDVILLDLLDDEYAFGLNLFQCNNPQDKKEVSRTISHIMEIFAKLFTDSGDLIKEAPNMARTLQYVIPVLLAHHSPHMTMAEIPLLIMDEIARPKLLAPVSNPMVQSFWRSYHRWRADRQEELTASTMSRLGNFLLDPLIMQIVGQAETTLNFRQIMDNSKILLVNLSRDYPLITSLIGSVIISQIANAAFSREDTAEDERVPFMLYADEYQRFATPTFAELLTEVRKYKIATCVAHQFRDQLDKANKGATLNAANMVVYQVSGEDAKELASQFERTPPPPAVDWIEEESGEQAVKTYKRDVIGHLLRQGHTDERVMDTVRGLLQELDLCSRRQVREHREEIWHGVYGYPRRGWTEYINETIYPKNHLGIEYDPEMIPPVLTALNNWLFAGMRDQERLWQPLPDAAFRWLAHFYDFEAVYKVLYEDYPKFDAGRELFLTKYDLTNKDFANCGFGSRELVKTAVAALEDALADFLSFLFPNQSRASIKTAWQQKAIDLTTCTFSEIQARCLAALEQITAAVRKDAHAHPDLDAAAYQKRFILELSKPELGLDVFLPAVLRYHSNVSPGRGNWRFTQREYVFLPYRKSKTEETYTYSLELYKSAMHQAIMKEIPKFLEPFQTYLRFFANLHCAQLALSQRKIETMESGQYEPDTRKHPLVTQRTYPEMESKIANELANPPLPFAAHVKLGTQEYTIQALPFKQTDGDAVWMARSDQIIERTRKNYCKKREDVDEEFKARQDALIKRVQRRGETTSDENEE